MQQGERKKWKVSKGKKTIKPREIIDICDLFEALPRAPLRWVLFFGALPRTPLKKLLERSFLRIFKNFWTIYVCTRIGGCKFFISSAHVTGSKQETTLETFSTQLERSLDVTSFERIEIQRFLHFGKVPPQIAPTNAVMDSLFKTVSPTVRAVARRSIISKGSEGIQIAQTRLRLKSQRKSSAAPNCTHECRNGNKSQNPFPDRPRGSA